MYAQSYKYEKIEGGGGIVSFFFILFSSFANSLCIHYLPRLLLNEMLFLSQWNEFSEVIDYTF